jgi:hypothetical protein
MNKSGDRATEDAISRMSRREEAPPTLAASMMRTQHWRVTLSTAARNTSLACNVCYVTRQMRWHAAASTVTHHAACGELDLEGKRLPVNRRAA